MSDIIIHFRVSIDEGDINTFLLIDKGLADLIQPTDVYRYGYDDECEITFKKGCGKKTAEKLVTVTIL